eukprot:831091-Prymnesium_polylepis.1
MHEGILLVAVDDDEAKPLLQVEPPAVARHRIRADRRTPLHVRAVRSGDLHSAQLALRPNGAPELEQFAIRKRRLDARWRVDIL